ncbi:glycoside hydrolase family 17 protein [Xylariaceae sp. FL0662B]|nr:glycoside hydrolase family 17 protein [Xylariaceae sp. FL0662B]
MKATYAVAAAAALAGAANAGSIHHRHAHGMFHALEKKDYDNSTCGCTTVCTTIYSTYYGEATLIPPPAPVSTSTVVVVPTPIPQTISTTGVYTFPATTVTLTESTTVPVPSSTAVPSGTHVIGGVTTIVSTATTVTCPYATVSTSEGVTTSLVATTTYVCPSAGTYTIAPTTTTVPADTTVTVPVVTSYPPGTYTQPEVVTTIHETSTVVYCPFDIPSAAPSTTAAPAPTTAPATTSSVVAPPTVSATSAPSSPQPSGSLGGPAGKPWGITYTPYKTDQEGGCKSESEVYSDVAKVAAAGVKTLRLYSTDCSTLEFVGGAAKKNGLKLILGVFIDTTCDISNPDVVDQVSAIKDWGKDNWDMVELIAIGNEAVLNGHCTPSALGNLIKYSKEQFSGYKGPFTTAETINVWQRSDFASVICPAIDYLSLNAHAFFNTQTVASQAGEFVKSQLDLVNTVCEKATGNAVPSIVTETGWPHDGLPVGLAIPGVSQQKEAIESIIHEAGDKSILFSLTSDKWKSDLVEQSFGCASVLGIDL